MRSFNLPFKISTLVILFILIFSSQNIFAQSGWQSTYWNNSAIINKIIKKDSLNYFAFSNTSKYYLKSSDCGNTWLSSQEFSLDSKYTITDGVFIDPNMGWIAGKYYETNNEALLKTTDGGITWISIDLGLEAISLNNISFVNENTGWLCVFGTAPLVKTTNGGLNWFSGFSYGSAGYLKKVKFVNNETGWVFAYGGFLSKTTNAGANWKVDSTFINLYIYDILPVSSNVCWVLARDGAPASRYYKTTNGGQNWDHICTNKNLTGELKFFDAQTGYAYAGDNNNVILKTTNGGSNWDSLYISSSQPVAAVLPSTKSEILAGGGRTTSSYEPPNTFVNVVKSTNSGSNWSEKFYNRNYNFAGVHFKDNQNGLAIESSGVIFRTTNGGSNWNKIYDNPLYPMTVIKGLNDANVLIFCSSGKILKTTNFGDNWIEMSTPVPDIKSKVDFLNEFTGYALGGTQFILRTTNAGLNWDSIRVPLGGGDFTETSPYSDISFINLNTGWLSAATSQYHYGGINPGFYSYSNVIKKTTNAGLSWTEVYFTYSNVQYSKIKFFNDSTGWTWRAGIIYQTTNSGTSWSVYNQNTSFTYQWLYMLNENTGWMIGTFGANNAICKTTDRGLNWTLQFNTPLRIINPIFIIDENNAWFGGADNAIYKTTNGGGVISAINPLSSNIPDGFSLKQNYPNPFNPTTKINVDLKNSAFAMLRVYDMTGREVRTLVNEKLSAGSYSYDFNASELPSGIYFYQLQTDGFFETKKMILLK